MCDLRATFNVQESRYRYDAENLASRKICRINALYIEAYRQRWSRTPALGTERGRRKRPSDNESEDLLCTEHAKNKIPS